MGHQYIRLVLAIILSFGLAACSGGGGKSKRSGSPKTGDGEKSSGGKAGVKGSLGDLSATNPGTARLTITEENGDSYELRFQGLDDSSAVNLELTGSALKNQSQLEALSNEDSSLVADVRNENKAGTSSPSVFYVITRAASERSSGSLYVFLYSKESSPRQVIGPATIALRFGLNGFSEIQQAYTSNGKSHFEYLGDMINFFNENPGANVASYKAFALAAASASQSGDIGELDDPDADGDTYVGSDSSSDFDPDANDGRLIQPQPRPRPGARQPDIRDSKGRVVRDSRPGFVAPQPKSRPQNRVVLVRENNTQLYRDRSEEPGLLAGGRGGVAYEIWAGIPPRTYNGNHHPLDCLHPQVRTYSAWGGTEVDIDINDDDSGLEMPRYDRCTPENRKNVLACRLGEDEAGGMTVCRIKTIWGPNGEVIKARWYFW